MIDDEAGQVAAYVEAVAPLLGFRFGDERQMAVIAIAGRLHEFACDIAAIDLPDSIEIAAEFTP